MPNYHQITRPYLIEAGQVALRAFLKATPQYKKDGSPITQADLDADAILQKGLQKHFPQIPIESEEGNRQPQNTAKWLIDPLDGTSAFTEGLAHWGPTIGLLNEEGLPVYGSLYLPRLEEEWFAQQGKGAFINHTPLPQMSNTSLRSDCVLYVPSKLHRYVKIDWPGKMRNLGSLAAHLCYVAGGRAQAAIVPMGWCAWDVVAGLTILQEVGGKTWCPDLTFSFNAKNRSFFIACNPAAFDWFQSKRRIHSLSLS